MEGGLNTSSESLVEEVSIRTYFPSQRQKSDATRRSATHVGFQGTDVARHPTELDFLLLGTKVSQKSMDPQNPRVRGIQHLQEAHKIAV